MPVFTGEVRGAAALVIACSHISPVIQEQAHQVGSANVRRLVQRRDATRLTAIGIGTGVEQRASEVRRRPSQRGVQRVHALRIAGTHAGIATPREQQFGCFRSAEERRQRQGLKAVVAERVHQRRVCIHERLQARQHAHGRSLVNREVGALLAEQPFGLFATAVIERIQNSRHVRRRCYYGPPMIFVDYLGPPERVQQVREVVAREVSAGLRLPADRVVVRHIRTDQERDEVELWVELSSDEQLYRLGRQLAQRISQALRIDDDGPNIWVMYRVVPLSHAFLNGEPRGRGTASLD